jgi:outer membrane protein assembly factor BamA
MRTTGWPCVGKTWLLRLLVACLCLASACSPARKEIDGNIVRKVKFEGNGWLLSGNNDLQLRNQMEQDHSSFGLLTWPFIYTVNPVPLRPELLPRDAYRLEVWYAHHGWFDAQVKGWELQRIRRTTDRRAGVIDIRGHIDPGPATFVRTLNIDGLDANLRVLGNSVLRTSPIRQGDQFDLELVNATTKLLLDRLHNLSRAYATVEVDIDVDADQHAGDITIKGNVVIPTLYIEQNLPIERGQSYSLDNLRASQRNLFGMSTFSIVTVQPDLSDPTRKDVPVEVSVTESKFRSFRIGAGLDYDGFLLAPRVSMRINHVNLFNQLVKAELGARAGLAYDVSVSETPTSIPTWGVSTTFSYPRIAAQKVALEFKAEMVQDVYSGLWAYQRPEAQLHLVWKLSDDIQIRGGPHIEQYKFIGDFGVRQEVAQARLFGIDATEGFQYQLTALDQFVTWDWRNEPVRTTRGSYYQLQLREAIPLTPQGYSFIRVNAEARRFVPVRIRRQGRTGFPVVLVGKTRGEVIQPLNQSQIPLPERAFLGGANSIRGFRPNQVGPYETLCTYSDVATSGGLFGDGTTTEEVTYYHLPSGGTLAAEVSAEARYDWIYGITLATFVDTGLLAPSWAELGFDDIRASAGVGARYDTLIGPLRFDLSFRPLYPEDEGPTRFRLCQEDDQKGRVFDFLGNFSRWQGAAHPNFATVFFFTIGESI